VLDWTNHWIKLKHKGGKNNPKPISRKDFYKLIEKANIKLKAILNLVVPEKVCFEV